MEQDRAPFVFLHQPELARQAIGEPRGHREFDFRHNDADWFKGAGKARHQLLSARGQGVKKADRRDQYSSRLVSRRMELYNSSQYLIYVIHLLHDDPLAEKIKKHQFTLKPLTGKATTAPEMWAVVLAA